MDVGRLTVDEGDSGVRTHHIPVRVSGRGSGKVRLFVPEPGTDRVTHRTVTVRPGSDDIDVPVEVRGNKRYGYDVGHDAFVKAVRGAVVGSHHGGVTARNDDPLPKATVEPVTDRVTEGKSLKWRMTLSEAVDVDITAGVTFLPVDDGAELSTPDVTRRWLEEEVGVPARPARKLSRMAEGDSLYVTVPAAEERRDPRADRQGRRARTGRVPQGPAVAPGRGLGTPAGRPGVHRHGPRRGLGSAVWLRSAVGRCLRACRAPRHRDDPHDRSLRGSLRGSLRARGRSSRGGPDRRPPPRARTT
ncbi:hypothetical protein SALBM135S_05668 [Streptomyces alboniger]